jgi:hypothetical protein
MKFFVYIVIVTAFSATAQNTPYKGLPSLAWPALYNIRFDKAATGSFEFGKPVFTDAVKALHGKIITLPGYMVPFENGIKGKHFMLSSLPLNACFFCGAGGPETVVEIFSKEPVPFTEKAVEIRGVLKLNDTDPDKMIYILENAEFIGEVEF